jgi:hypothetical protein
VHWESAAAQRKPHPVTYTSSSNSILTTPNSNDPATTDVFVYHTLLDTKVGRDASQRDEREREREKEREKEKEKRKGVIGLEKQIEWGG